MLESLVLGEIAKGNIVRHPAKFTIILGQTYNSKITTALNRKLAG